MPSPSQPGAPYVDGQFRNLDGTLDERSFGDILKWWLFEPDAGSWQAVEEKNQAAPPPERVGPGELRITYIGHATLLVQVSGLNILTDPVYSERVGPYSWLGSARYRPPGIPFEQLPPIDVVVVSHDHYDHMDVATLEALALRDRPRFLVPLGNDARMTSWGLAGATPLDWWQSEQVTEAVKITAVPAQHWSRRGPTDKGKTLWAGFVFEAPGGPVYFAGDTAWGPHIEFIGQHFGPMRAALLPIGAYKPEWFMRTAHMGPTEAVDAAVLLRAARTIPMHFGTFALGDDGQTEAVEVLTRYAQSLPTPPAIWVLGFGEGRDIAPLPPSIPDVR